jgi:hypothetical protein
MTSERDSAGRPPLKGRSPDRWSFPVLCVLLSATLIAPASAQVKITLGDLFTEKGLYYRAYANHLATNANDVNAYEVAPGLISSAGADNVWDFSAGPTNEIFRVDYLAPAEVPQAVDFPRATIVERKVTESGGPEQLFLGFREPIPGKGLNEYGFYAEEPGVEPEKVFQSPIIDFPDPIVYGAEWSSTATYLNTLTITNGADVLAVPVLATVTSTFRADAYGKIILPAELGVVGEGLRIYEEVEYEYGADFGGGSFQTLMVTHAKAYYWMMPGYGLVAQLGSPAGSSPPPDNFSRAALFIRMFETNKKGSTNSDGCATPQAVGNLKISVNGNVILLSWTKADCANQYGVQYTETPTVLESWKPLGAPITGLLWRGENTSNGKARFYRVLSLK